MRKAVSWATWVLLALVLAGLAGTTAAAVVAIDGANDRARPTPGWGTGRCSGGTCLKGGSSPCSGRILGRWFDLEPLTPT